MLRVLAGRRSYCLSAVLESGKNDVIAAGAEGMEKGGRCGPKEARPRADHTRSEFQTTRGWGGEGYLTGLCARLRDGRRRGLASRYREREEGGSAPALFACFSFSFPQWSPRGSWKQAGSSRNLKVWMSYSQSSAGAEQSSSSLEDLRLSKLPPSVLGVEARNRFYTWAPRSLADRCALWPPEQVTCPLQQPRQTSTGCMTNSKPHLLGDG